MSERPPGDSQAYCSGTWSESHHPYGNTLGFTGASARHLTFGQVAVDYMKGLQATNGAVAIWEGTNNHISLLAKMCHIYSTGDWVDDPLNYDAVIIATTYYNYALGLSDQGTNGEKKVL